MEEKYFLSGPKIFEVLRAKHIEYLHHANTLATSITFLEQGALFSRSYVQSRGWIQTPQASDGEDQKYNVWDDIFLDGIDLHKEYKSANSYGPILFFIDLNFLNSPQLAGVLVTRKNPWYWRPGESDNEHYYSSIDEVSNEYRTQSKLDSQTMFTFRSIGDLLQVNPFVKAIGIDKPDIIVTPPGLGKDPINVGDFARSQIQAVLTQKGLNIPIYFRHSNAPLKNCRCHTQYNNLISYKPNEFRKRFSPLR